MAMESNKTGHDPYCWKCCGEDTKLKCSVCVRSFHISCVKDESPEPNSNTDWMCPVCIQIKTSTTAKKSNGVEMLQIILNRVDADTTFNSLKYPMKRASYSKHLGDSVIVKSMNVTTLQNNADSYRSFEEFFADANWIYHNSKILHGEGNEKTRTARMLMDYFSEEIESVKKCFSCYRNAIQQPDTWFALVCDEPHLIVWAKMKGFNYWPAKLMSVDGQLLNVRFFGDHTHADVPVTNCFLYSKQNPGRMRNSTTLHCSALKEADEYIENIRHKFGSFNLAEDRIVFNPAQIQTYLSDTIPGLAELRKAKLARIEEEAEDESDKSVEIEPPANVSVDEEEASCSNGSGVTSPDQSSMTMNVSNKELFVNLTRLNEVQIKNGIDGNDVKIEEDEVTDRIQMIERNGIEEQIIEADDDQKDPKDDEVLKEDASTEVKPSEPDGSVEQAPSQKRSEPSPDRDDEPSEKKVRFSDDSGGELVDIQTFDLENDDINIDNIASKMASNVMTDYAAIENRIKEVCRENLVKVLKYRDEDRRQMVDMKLALNKTINERNELEKKVEHLEQSTKVLHEALAVLKRLKSQKSKPSCGACGTPLDTVLFCNSICGQNGLKRNEVPDSTNDENEVEDKTTE